MYKCERCDWTGSSSELGITPSIVASVTAHLRGKHYRVVRSADMMLRTSKKSKKKSSRKGAKQIFMQDQYNTGKGKSQWISKKNLQPS